MGLQPRMQPLPEPAPAGPGTYVRETFVNAAVTGFADSLDHTWSAARPTGGFLLRSADHRGPGGVARAGLGGRWPALGLSGAVPLAPFSEEPS
ncbi:hypothetical protein ACFXA3_02585 [Streptomyces sp. NPDC059456]|uniref:hypothetical protein n=1 Tax=Streptomyces sp. NPDC059456 TaxID=3346838 RepID=UPI00367F4496